MDFNRNKMTLILISAATGFILALILLPKGGGKGAHQYTTEKVSQEKTIWSCSMHPQIQLPLPGNCPICGMELIPIMGSSSSDDSPRILVMSPASKELIKIRTSPVERKVVTKKVRMVGKVDYDETRIFYITAWVAGRIDELYADYTGIRVRKEDHMANIYSPELLSAQEEYLQAIQNVQDIQESHLDVLKSSSKNTLINAREKLRLLGIKEDQIKAIETRGMTTNHMTLHAPVGGVVLKKHVNEGDYVHTGSRIYTLADLDYVWVLLNAYESDITWLRYGQNVEFEVESYPGETFHGVISFIDPVLDEVTRTIKVRVNVDNENQKLKPGMFVRALVRSHLVSGSHVAIDSSLKGKWISPMHPEIIRDEPGPCPVCGMDLVPAESLGYVSEGSITEDLPLVIPESAPLITGKKAVVYVELPGQDKPTFEGREITLGPRAGRYYIVLGGLSEGDMVVTNGNFKIDSALQIKAKPSMMSPADEEHHHHDKEESI